VSDKTRSGIVMCSEPAMRAPFSTCFGQYPRASPSGRHPVRPARFSCGQTRRARCPDDVVGEGGFLAAAAVMRLIRKKAYSEKAFCFPEYTDNYGESQRRFTFRQVVFSQEKPPSLSGVRPKWPYDEVRA